VEEIRRVADGACSCGTANVVWKKTMMLTELIPIRPAPPPFYDDVVAVKVLVVDRFCVVYFYNERGEETDKCRVVVEEEEYAIWAVREEYLVELTLDKMGLERQQKQKKNI
jgi:hypothetical protein